MCLRMWEDSSVSLHLGSWLIIRKYCILLLLFSSALLKFLCLEFETHADLVPSSVEVLPVNQT